MKRSSAAAGRVLLLACAAAVATYGRRWQLPDRHNPFVPLVVADAPNWLTRYKLDRLDRDADLCRSVLWGAGAAGASVPDRDAGAECGWSDAVQLRSTSAVTLASPLIMSCRTAVSLSLWSRHVLQPAAMHHLGQRVRRLDHVGSYACRNVNSAADGRRSRHARAEALDLTGFVLEDGSRISVLRDWHRGDRRATFLRDAHSGACRWFDGVLGPAYNALHADHLHFERGPSTLCR